MPIQQIEDMIASYWEGLPAIIKVAEIKRRSQFPTWEKCPRDRLYVGIIRRKRGDRVVVVKHQMEMNVSVNGVAECLTDKDWYYAGVMPCHKEAKMICKKCGQFSTRINTGCLCTDCLPKIPRFGRAASE